MVFAEALSFALAQDMPRAEAQAAVKGLANDAKRNGTPLLSCAEAAYPKMELRAIFDPSAQLGTAPEDARSFAHAVRAKK